MRPDGYSSALMGFDFADADTLDLARYQFAKYLMQNGIDDEDLAEEEARKLNRSWEFATYAYCHIDYRKPEAAWILGKDFMLHHMSAWRGLMDMRPGSPHLRIFEKYIELRERRYHLPEHHDYQRSLSKFEKRVDFAAIERVFNEDALKVDLEIRAEIKKALKRIIDQIEQRAKTGGLNEQFVLALQVDTGTGIPRILGQYLTDVWRRGRDLALKELPETVKKAAEPIKRYAGLEPTQAINFLQNLRPWLIKGIIDDELKKTTRLELSEHLKGGRTLTETIGNLRADFEPFIGDPEKIIPSGLGIPAAENILQAFRLENVIRTESITALNQGRLAVGDEAGDFVIGYEYSAILDERVTQQICAVLDGLKIRAGDGRLAKLNPPNHFQALAEGTLITTIEGKKPIECIQPDEMVLTHRGRHMPVYAVMARDDLKMARDLHLDSGRMLRITDEHPVLTLRGWQRCRDLKIGDVLFQDGEQLAGRRDVVLPDPDNFPSPFDEPCVPYKIMRLSTSGIVSFPIDFQCDLAQRKGEINHVRADGELRDAVSIASQYSDGHLFKSSESAAPTSSHTYRCFRRDIGAPSGIVPFHSLGVPPSPRIGLLAFPPSPVGSAANRLAGTHMFTRCDSLRSHDEAEFLGELADRVVSDSEGSLDASDRFAAFPVASLNDSFKDKAVSKIPHWIPTQILHISSAEVKGRVWNLAVQEDETYLAEDVIVHNCRSILVYITSDDVPVEFSTDEELDDGVRRIMPGFA